jgi:hypothetical protein
LGAEKLFENNIEKFDCVQIQKLQEQITCIEINKDIPMVQTAQPIPPFSPRRPLTPSVASNADVAIALLRIASTKKAPMKELRAMAGLVGPSRS